MEKQYSTHYLPEKYEQHQFIDIYNFEIIVSKTQSTEQRQKSQGNGDVRFFSTRARRSGHRVSLAKRPRLSLHGTIMKNRCRKLFVSKTLSRNQDHQVLGLDSSQLCFIKIFNIKGVCILNLILASILSILILSVKNKGEVGGFT